MSYCQYVASLPDSNHHRAYHDFHYGFPLEGDTALFERLMLEVFQAGLSWDLILKRQAHFFEAFHGWDLAKVAAFDEEDVERLMGNALIIRNRKKIEAAIYNANVILQMGTQGGFQAWLNQHHPLEKSDWVKLFGKTFKFTGGEIVGEFLMSTGYLGGAHEPSCPIYAAIEKLNPPWLAVKG